MGIRTLSVVVFMVWSCLFAGAALAQDDVGVAHESMCCGVTCCLIEGACISSATATSRTNPRNPCQICDPAQSQVAWTDVAGCVFDAGPPPPDAGPPDPPPGGCSIAPGASALPAGIALLGLLGLAIRRRR